jgi:hypothetical protein
MYKPLTSLEGARADWDTGMTNHQDWENREGGLGGIGLTSRRSEDFVIMEHQRQAVDEKF